jgi:transitional endoplasmic reticulum ATPase
MRYFLEQFQSEKDKFSQAWSDGRRKEARKHLLQAAKYLLLAAEKTSGDESKELLQRSKKLSEMAKDIDTSDKAKLKNSEEEASKENKWLVTDIPKISFDDVAGLEEAKRYLRERVIVPMSHPEESRKFGIQPGGGLLLYGPPGTGKTMIAKAIANEVAASFFSVKSSDIISKWVGDSERNIRQLFTAAKDAGRATIFIDEIEALLPRRGGNSTVMNRVVPEILGHLDGIETIKASLLILGATNRPWDIDDAFLRPGRFDKMVYVGLPNDEARAAILRYHLGEVPMDNSLDLQAIAARTDGYSGADLMGICKAARALPFMREVESRTEQKLTEADFEEIIGSSSPSVTEKLLGKYDKYRQMTAKH